MQCFIRGFCVSSGVNTTDYTNNLLLKYIQSLQMNRCRSSPNMDTVWIWGSISALYKFSNVSDSNDLRAFMIIPVPLAILREMHFICSSQFSLLSIITPKTFCIVNLQNTGSIYMNGWTLFLFTLRSEYHEICFNNIKRQSVCIQPFYYITKFIIDDCGQFM